MLRIVNTLLLLVIAALLAWYIVPKTEFGERLQLRHDAREMGLPEPSTPADYSSVQNFSEFVGELEKDGRKVPQSVTQELWRSVRTLPEYNSLPADSRGEIEKMMLSNALLMIQAPMGK